MLSSARFFFVKDVPKSMESSRRNILGSLLRLSVVECNPLILERYAALSSVLDAVFKQGLNKMHSVASESELSSQIELWSLVCLLCSPSTSRLTVESLRNLYRNGAHFLILATKAIESITLGL